MIEPVRPPMTFVDALGHELADTGLAKKDFAFRAEIPPSTVYNWFSRQGSDPSVELARKAAKALGTTIEGLIDKHTPGKQQEKSTIRRRLDTFLDQLNDTELRVLLGTARAIVDERQAEDHQSASSS